MNENEIEQQSFEKIEIENLKLKKDYDKAVKRLDRITKQGDRQQKQFEKLNQQLEVYLDVVDDHVISMSLDKDKNIKAVSTVFSNRFGFKEKEIIGKNLRFLLDHDTLGKLNVELLDSVASKLKWIGELKLRNKSDIPVWTETTMTPNFTDNELDGYTVIIEDISKDKALKDLKTAQLESKKYDQSMLEYMSSRSAALLQRTENSFSYVLWTILATVIWLIVWANYAELEERTKGKGKIIPSSRVKKVESYDNSIIKEILVKEGDHVKKGQLLVRFDNMQNNVSFQENALRIKELFGKAQRLEFESEFKENSNIDFFDIKNLNIPAEERDLCIQDMEQLKHKLAGINEQILQKSSEYKDASKKYIFLRNNYNLLKQELDIKRKMEAKRVLSKVEFLQFQREVNNLSQKLSRMKSEIEIYTSTIAQLKQNKKEVILSFRNDALKEYLQLTAEISRLSKNGNSLNNILTRDKVLSPVDGTIKKMYVNTIGEVASAGTIILEVVPDGDRLMVEVMIEPEDIAYIRIDEDAMMKFTAYDFNIYGGIRAKVSYISADTIQDDVKKDKQFYIIYLKMNRDYILHNGKKLPIKVGMTADVDIIHGKKTVMDYILKPILKAKQNALTEK